VLGSQPVTLTVDLDSLCSEALHRTMLVRLLHHQSYILCFVFFVTNYQMIWFQSGKYIFFILESIQNFNIFYPAEIAPLETEIAPKSGKYHKIAPITHKTTPHGGILPSLNTTGLE